MEYTILEIAKMAGISTRTLRYYDQIQLLCPAYLNDSGYRIYQEKQVDILQQILFYREMGFELSRIKQMISSPSFNQMEALREHLKELKMREKQLHLLINNVKKTIKKEEGEITMMDQEKFEGFKKELVTDNEGKYGREIREKYGSQTVEESNAKMMNLTQEEYERMQKLTVEINRLLEKAVTEKESPKGELGQKIAQMHKDWLGFTWAKYSRDGHRGLVQMYVSDERFTSYYDKEVRGCARFLKEAVEAMTD